MRAFPPFRLDTVNWLVRSFLGSTGFEAGDLGIARGKQEKYGWGQCAHAATLTFGGCGGRHPQRQPLPFYRERLRGAELLDHLDHAPTVSSLALTADSISS